MPAPLAFAALPPLWPSYVRALLGRRPALLPAGATVPALEARADGIVAPARRLAAYRGVCGFPARGSLPVTYPHVLAMPLHLALLTSDAFPLRPLGLVHVRNRIESAFPLADGDRLDLRCALSGHRETERGQEVELVTEVRRAGRLAWSEASVLLARRRAAGGARGGPPTGAGAPVLPEAVRWDFPADAGRRYARVSGDANPIHLSRLTARAFGFERAIAHGMWSLARIAAELGPKLPEGPLALEAAFKLPILLPARVMLRHGPAPGGLAFALTDEGGARPHVTGALTGAAG